MHQSFSKTSLISPSIQIALLAISRGATASPLLMQTYVAFGLPYVICQKGYLMMPGVLFALYTIQWIFGASRSHSTGSAAVFDSSSKISGFLAHLRCWICGAFIFSPDLPPTLPIKR